MFRSEHNDVHRTLSVNPILNIKEFQLIHLFPFGDISLHFLRVLLGDWTFA